MRRLLATLALIALPFTAHAAEDAGFDWEAFGGNLAFDAGGIDVDNIFGANVLAATVSGNSLTLRVQLDTDCQTENGCTITNVVFTPSGGGTGGASITAGTADPTGGSDGDAYIQINASNVIQSLWRNASGTWTEYTLPTGSSATLSDTAPQNVISGTAAAGTGTAASRHDHVHSGVPVPATTVVSTSYDSAGTVGTNANYARQDHRHGLDKTSRFDDGDAPQNVTTGTGASGDDTVPARRDHVHGGDSNTQRALSDAAPADVTTGTGSAGSSTTVSRSDHVHGGDTDTNTQLTLSDSAPANIAASGSAGSNSEVSREDHVHGGAPQPADSIVAETITATGTTGTSTTEFAREDHRHGINVAGLFDSTAPEDIGTAAAGSATVAARRDHVHGGGGTGTGDITAVLGTAPIVVTGGASGDATVTITAATTAAAGSMSSADKTKLDGIDTSASSDFTGLTDTPATITASQCVQGNGAGDALVFGACGTGGGVSAFTGLSDTPGTITADQCVLGNTAGDALIFGACGTGGGGDITAVLGTAPIVVTGGDTGDATVTITNATTSAPGAMTAADKTKLDGLERQIELIDSLNDVAYNQNDPDDLSTRFGGNAYVADIDAEGTADAEINDLIVFQWRDNPSGVPAARELGIRINQTGTTLPIRIVSPLTNALVNKTVADLTRYEFLFLSRQDGVFIQLAGLALAEVMGRLVPTGGTVGQVLTKDSATDNDVSWTTVTGGTTLSDTTPVNTATASAGTATTASRGDHDHGITGGGGSSTLTGLTDTPGAYTNAALQLLRVNATENSVEFFPEPSNQNTIPHVGRIPAVTPTSPDLIFLTHDEIDGVRDDATMTIGRDAGNSCGYSDGSVYSPAFGSIDEPSPITSIFGIWNATDSNCDLSEVYTTNEGWLDDQATIRGTVSGTAFTCNLGTRLQRNGQFAKRFTSCGALEDLALGDITINFFTADATPQPYWTDGSTTNPAGLYEKVGTPPAYHDIRPIEESHRTGSGSFACGDAEPPTDGGQVCITSDGEASFSTDRTVLVEQAPEITTMTEFTSNYWEGASANVIGFTNSGDNGQFKWYTAGDIFFQIQGTRATGVLTVTGVANTAIPSGTRFERDGVGTTYVRTTADATIGAGGTVNVAAEASAAGSTGNNIPNNATFTPDPAFTGVTSATVQTGFTGGTGDGIVDVSWEEAWTYIATIDSGDSAADQSLHDALRDNSVFLGEFSQTQDAAEDRDEYTVTTDRYFYIIHGDEGTMQEITGFTAGVSEESTDHQWIGPVVTIEDVHDIFEPNSGETVTHVLDDFRVGDRVYSVIVRPDPNSGTLRAPTAADYNTMDARSRVVAVVDGKPYKVRRMLADGHTATGTFTPVAAGTSLAAGGSGTFRYRGVFDADQDISQPEEDDIYYNIRFHHWRVRDHDPAYGNYWYTLPNGGEILTRLRWVDYFTTEIDALGHATSVGQRFVLPQGNAWALYTLTTFTAAQPAHYEYSWTEAVPLPVLPQNVRLVDDVSLEWASSDKPSVEVEFSQALAESDDDRPILIDYRPNAAGSETRAAGNAILAEHIRHLTTLRPLMLDKTGGGRTPIDRTVDISNSPGSVEFSFPLSTGGNALRWMRIHYIGDHIDDVDGSFSLAATTLTLDDSAGITVGANYWMIGPVTGAGCPVTMHSEKVTVTEVGNPNPHDITVVRGVDGTALDDVNCVSFASGADFILDDKTTFTMVPSADAQDSGDFTFTLLAQGAGGSGGTGNTDITIGSRTADSFTIQSSSGDDAIAPAATGSLAGIMTAADKSKLNGVATDATRCVVYTTYSAADTHAACDTVVLTQNQYDNIATPVAGVSYKIRAPLRRRRVPRPGARRPMRMAA